MPETHAPLVSSERPILITTEHPKGQIIISHIPEEYSQNPEHINHIAGDTLFYKDLGKLKAKLKLVEGKKVHHHDKLGPSLFILRS